MNTRPGIFRSWWGWIGPALAGTIMWGLLLALPVALEGQEANGCEEPACGIPYDSLVADTTALHRMALEAFAHPVRCSPRLSLYECRVQKMEARSERMEKDRTRTFELWKGPEDGPLVVFPADGFYLAGEACREYAAMLNAQDAQGAARVTSDENPLHLERYAGNGREGFHCRAR